MKFTTFALLFLIIMTLLFGGLELISFGKINYWSSTVRPWIAAKWAGKERSLTLSIIFWVVVLTSTIFFLWTVGWVTLLVIWAVVWTIYVVIWTAKDDEPEPPRRPEPGQ